MITRALTALFIMVAGLVGGILPAASQANLYPSTLQPNTVIGRTGVSAGPPQAVPFSILIQDLANTPNVWTPLQTFNGGVLASGACSGQNACIQSVPTGNEPAWFSFQALSGSFTGGAANSYFINSDNADASSTNGLTYWNYAVNFGGSALQGTRNGLGIAFNMTAPTSASNPNADRNYVAFNPRLSISSGDNGTSGSPQGFFFTMNPQCFGQSGATFLAEITCSEWDFGLLGTATSKILAGMAIVNQGTALATVTAGNTQAPFTGAINTYMWFYNGNTAAISHVLHFGIPATAGSYPVGTGGTVMFSEVGTVANFIDVTNLTISGCALTAPGSLCIDGSGNYTTGSVAQILKNTAPPSGGTVFQGYLMSSTPGFGIYPGSGAPSLSAAKGSLYLRSDGGLGTSLYVNTSGSTTWTPIPSGVGVSQTCTVNTASALTLIFTNGILTGGTCNI